MRCPAWAHANGIRTVVHGEGELDVPARTLSTQPGHGTRNFKFNMSSDFVVPMLDATVPATSASSPLLVSETKARGDVMACGYLSSGEGTPYARRGR